MIYIINNEVFMSWGEVKMEDQRIKFIDACLEGNHTMADICRIYQISPKTAYKWLNRFKAEGIDGLKDRSRAPLKQALKTEDEIVQEILRLKFQYSKLGPKKIKCYLEEHYPDNPWPSATTIGNIFDKNGLTVPRKFRRRVPARTQPFSHCLAPNDVWCADFKGWFLTGDGNKSEPFTVTDGASRFLLRCLDLEENKFRNVWGVLDVAFREYGLPLYFKTDNGPPFATCGAGRLSKLSVNLIKAHVIPEWIDPGNPQQNGRHERMHGTLKTDTANPPEDNLMSQGIKYDEFREYYNYIRPHEAIGQKTPGSVYQSSSREWNGILRSPEYPKGCLVRKIRPSGQLRMKQIDIHIGSVLAGEPVGLNQIGEDAYEVYYGPIYLGKIDQNMKLILPAGAKRKRKVQC